jgi:hypothetical protein
VSPDQSAPAGKTPQTRSSDPTLKLRRRGESEAIAMESRAGVWSHRFEAALGCSEERPQLGSPCS